VNPSFTGACAGACVGVTATVASAAAKVLIVFGGVPMSVEVADGTI